MLQLFFAFAVSYIIHGTSCSVVICLEGKPRSGWLTKRIKLLIFFIFAKQHPSKQCSPMIMKWDGSVRLRGQSSLVEPIDVNGSVGLDELQVE